jgi:hypothetical protein
MVISAFVCQVDEISKGQFIHTLVRKSINFALVAEILTYFFVIFEVRFFQRLKNDITGGLIIAQKPNVTQV